MLNTQVEQIDRRKLKLLKISYDIKCDSTRLIIFSRDILHTIYIDRNLQYETDNYLRIKVGGLH